MTPLQRYQSDLNSGLISDDEEQRRVVGHLQSLFDDLLQLHTNRWDLIATLQRWIPGQDRTFPERPRGIYLWGGVGRGKTYLMDILSDCLPKERRLRTHFHRFMQGVHHQLRELQGISNPLERVAEELAEHNLVLCFDEFFVFDIADAMILSNLLDALFRQGVVLVTTSNIEPDGLYENGLQRARFLPAIELLRRHTNILHITDGPDYRLRTLSQATLFYYPFDATTEARLHSSFQDLAPDPNTIRKVQPVEILGRNIQTISCADDVVWFDFEELCGGPRSAFDYVEIAKLYHAVILSAVPQLDDDSNDQARRFVNLVDELYDRRVKLIVAAAVAIEHLYMGSRLELEFKRTTSRLIEMQSLEYLACEHRA